MNKGIIGTNAGVVWRLMDNCRRQYWSYAELKEATELSDMDLCAALGWLARENKVEFSEEGEGRIFLNVCYFF